MFGGWTCNSGDRTRHEGTTDNCDYFMIWNTDSMTWKQGKSMGTPPTTRYGHTATAIGPHLLIFGGWEFSKAQNEIIVLREFNQPAEEEQKSELPQAEDNYGEEPMYNERFQIDTNDILQNPIEGMHYELDEEND